MKSVALFPGQGSQHVGMGKTLFEQFSAAREVFEEASDAIHLNLKNLCFEGPESDLVLTENTQPCLVTTEIAAFRVAQKELGFTPTLVAGHSLGEYSALVAAGSIPLSMAVSWVQARGRSMQKAVPPGEGKMAAIMGLEDAVVESLCERATQEAEALRSSSPSALSVKPLVQPANFNAPGQVVIAGSADGIEQALALLSSGAVPGGKAIPLAVSAPFHCALMEPARNEMAALFQKTALKPGPLQCPYIPNRKARITSENGVVLELLIEQIDHTVRWKQSMEALIQAGYSQAIEFGPGKVLQGLAKRISKTVGSPLEVLSVGDPDSLKALETLK